MFEEPRTPPPITFQLGQAHYPSGTFKWEESSGLVRIRLLKDDLIQ